MIKKSSNMIIKIIKNKYALAILQNVIQFKETKRKQKNSFGVTGNFTLILLLRSVFGAFLDRVSLEQRMILAHLPCLNLCFLNAEHLYGSLGRL